ncbi:MAG: ATP synthase F1 subunit delta [Bacteroidetes bacterium GWA2_32_17]|nr:MAG: ATP synthase F1 subunit delta [Bacteroidetes bacterium GWA2_32_17]
MNYSKIGVRYAKALLLTAVEENILEKVKNDMQFIHEVIATVPEFNHIFNSPVVKPSEKQNIFKNTFEPFLSKLTINFVEMLIKHRRESRLSDVIRNFFAQYKINQGIVTASLITPIKIDDNLKNEISQLLHSKYNKTIELLSTIDSSIIGGFVLQIEDIQYDASVKTRLKKVRNELMNTQLLEVRSS